MLVRIFFTAVACVFLEGSFVCAGDWPAWRGPLRDDISLETGLLQQWPADGPEKLWMSTEAGLGYSGFAIVGNVLYTMGADGKESDSSEFVIAIDAETGKKLWQSRVGAFLSNGWGGGPRSTPTISGDRLVAIGGNGDIVCLSITDGSETWRASLTELGGTIPFWGYCESALVDGEKVLVTPGGNNGTVACLSLQTGEKQWQSADMTVAAQYSSIIAVNHFGQRQYIQLTQSLVFGLDEDGNLLWQNAFQGRTAVIPTPIYRDGLVYVTAGYGAGCMLLNVTADNKVEMIYENKVMKNHHGGALLLGDFVYGHSDPVGMVCQNLMTGEEIWCDNKKNGSKGSVAYADGMLYCLEEGSGDCFLVKASPTGYEEVSRFKLDPQTKQRSERGRIWTHPVICNGKLYLRDQEIICCYRITE